MAYYSPYNSDSPDTGFDYTGGAPDGTNPRRKKRTVAPVAAPAPTGPPRPTFPAPTASEPSALGDLGAPPPTPRLTAVQPKAGLPSQPMGERLPDGRSVAQVIQDLQVGPQAPPPGGGRVFTPPPPDVHLGSPVTPGMNRLGALIAEHDTLANDPSGSNPVKRTPWGYEELPPEKSPSRWKQVGLGVLQGALAGVAQTGSLAGALGGAATGGVAGGVSPRLMQAFTRAQDIRRNQGEISNELELSKQQAQVGGLEAEADWQRARPGLEAAEIRRKLDAEEAALKQRREEELGRNQRAEADRRNRIDVAGIRSRPGTSGTQGAIAAEGGEEARQAVAASKGIPEAIKKWDDDNKRDDAWMRDTEREWDQEAVKQYQTAMEEWKAERNDPTVFVKSPKPKLSDIQAEVRAASPKKDTYAQVKANREQRAKDIEDEKKKLDKLDSERRSGTAKTARAGATGATTTTSGAGALGPDGKHHYTMAQIQATINPKTGLSPKGKRLEEVLNFLRNQSNVVIDDDQK